MENDEKKDQSGLETMNYNDRPDGYGFGEAESRDYSQPYENDDHFNNRYYDPVRGVTGHGRKKSCRDWNRWRFVEPYTRDEYGLRNQYGPVDQYSFRDVYVRQWSGPDGTDNNVERREDHTGKGPKGYTRSDERIKEDVSEALYMSPIIDASEMEVSVRDGCVYLQGVVEDRRIKREAERLIEHLPGIIDVQNELKVKKTGDFLSQVTGDHEDKEGLVQNRTGMN